MSKYNTMVTFSFSIDHDEENVLDVGGSTEELTGILLRTLEEKLTEMKGLPSGIAFASFELDDTQEN